MTGREHEQDSGPVAEHGPSEARRIAWRRDVPDHDFMHRWSLQHRVLEGAFHTLCGVRPRWAYEGPGESGRDRVCRRCDAIAVKRGYVDDPAESSSPDREGAE